MTSTIVLAGATGNLGLRIAAALRTTHDAKVVALVRKSSDEAKVETLRKIGADIAFVDMSSASELSAACAGADCVVSAVQGLRDVIVDAQTRLLQAAATAGTPRFIPSDFSTDFTKLPAGENRNFDLRRDFHAVLDRSSVASTSIYNGAFGEILTYNIPLLDLKKKVVGYWDDADWKIDFSSMDDTAAFTAAAAVDTTTPSELRIASFQITPRELLSIASETLRAPFQLVKMGTCEELRAHNAKERAAHPEGEREIFPRWQQSQYMLSMFTAHHEAVDNARYPSIKWTNVQTLLQPLANRIG